MPATPDKGPHYSLIEQSLPDWLHTTAWPRAQALSHTPLDWLAHLQKVPADQHAPLKAANAKAWATQNAVDQRLNALQDVYAFATPLLTAALQQHYELTLDVRTTHVLLVIEHGSIIKGSTSRTLSLLNAALQNFADDEQFTSSSRYITQPDARGHFDVLAHHTRMSIDQFVDLCRELDLGTLYAHHLKEHLLPPLEADKKSLQAQVIASQQAALNSAAHLAQLRGEIDAATFHLVQRTVRGERGVTQFYRLRLMETLLTGVLLIASDLDLAKDVVPVVVYIPHDPKGAIRAYPSTVAFREDLASKLKDPAYRQFFSQFVDHPYRAAFIEGQRQRAPYSAIPINGELWPQLYQAALNKILNDGRELAVSTADIDRRTHSAWWDAVAHILESVLNVALLVASPFVPVLGEVMLAYTAFQLLDEVVEGVVDLAQGQVREGASHLVAVVIDALQLATFGVGGKLAQSAFINQLKAVEVNGKTRLWNPDPTPYQHDLQLPADSVPDEAGLHSHAGQQVLPWEGEHYVLKPDAASDDYRVQHATRAEAYAPPITRDTSPRAWSDQRRLSELGPFNTEQQQQVLAISGLDHNQLRAVQTDNRAAPLLDDTLKRMRLLQQASEMPEQLRAGGPVDNDTYWSPYIARELAGWSQDHVILVYENADLSGEHLRFGEADASQTLSISRDDLNQGKLPERIVDSLDDTSLRTLLGEAPEGRTAQIAALRNRMADQLGQRRGALFAYLYKNTEDLTTARGVQVRKAFPGLPKNQVNHVLDLAWPEELDRLDTEKRLPLRLKNIARELDGQAKAAHALQGFYDPQLLGPGSEQILLDTLDVYSDSLEDCRIEIRQHTPIANVRASAGPQNASTQRLLVKDNGLYEVYDNSVQTPQPAGSLFDAVLEALPPQKRKALGYAPGDGEALKDWVKDTLRTPDSRREVFANRPVGLRQPTKDIDVLAPPPMHTTVGWFCQMFPGALERRVKSLYPYASQGAIETYLDTLDDPVQLQQFEAREHEKLQLHHELTQWTNAVSSEYTFRRSLADGILRAWEANIQQTAMSLKLSRISSTGALGSLRLSANFDHIQHLEMYQSVLSEADLTFFAHFPRLISINLSKNIIPMLPQALQRMTSLTHLTLMETRIRWDAATLEQLAGLTQLRQLNLSHNSHLTVAPDIGRMRHLDALHLNNTGIRDWPGGLFVQPRSSGFYLNLQNTEVTQVPQFLPWTPEAEVVANARLDRNRLTTDAEQQLISYRLAAGLDPYRTYEPRGDSAFWLVEEPLRDHVELNQVWQDLEQEHGSQGFFEIIKSLEVTDNFQTSVDLLLAQAGRTELTGKVWRMLRAMHGDHTLRARLFLMASNPVNCADAGAQIFNAMGIEVRLTEINRNLASVTRERELTELARGKSRLDRLNQFAKGDIAQRIKPVAEGGQGLRFNTDVINGVPGTVDEVEVYLAYQTALQERLKLPWVSPHMSYRVMGDVSSTQLENAVDTVRLMDAGDELADALLEQPLWDLYLRETYAPQFQASLDHAHASLAPLDDLSSAQSQWASASAEERLEQQPQLLALADALKVPHADVLTGHPMTTQTYERILASGFSEELPSQTDLARRLTREALQRLEAHEATGA